MADRRPGTPPHQPRNEARPLWPGGGPSRPRADLEKTGAADRPAKLTIPPLDEGPHTSYAVQWFSFAAIALAGAGFVIKQARDGERQRAANPVRDASAESDASG